MWAFAFRKDYSLVALLKTKLQFFCIYISRSVRTSKNLVCLEGFITIQLQFHFQTHNKSQSFESRTNTNGLCSTSSLTWVNINSKYFSCMLFSEYVYGITQSEILYTKTLLLSIPLKSEIPKNIRTSIYNQII